MQLLPIALIGLSLGSYQGIYELVAGDYPECVRHRYIQLHYDQHENSLEIEGLDDWKRSRGWQWLYFKPLDGKRRLVNAFFTMSEYERFKVRKSKKGLSIIQEQKECNMRFLCGRWHRSEVLVLMETSLRINVRDDVAPCSYHKLDPATG